MISKKKLKFLQRESADLKIRAFIQTVALQRIDKAASRKDRRVIYHGSVVERSLSLALADEGDVVRRKQGVHMHRPHQAWRGNHDDNLFIRVRRIEAVRKPFAPKYNILAAELVTEFEISRIAIAKKHGSIFCHRTNHLACVDFPVHFHGKLKFVPLLREK